jgi:hypothetical protein
LTTAEFTPDPVLNEKPDTEFVPAELESLYVPLPQKVYVKADEMTSDNDYQESYLADAIRAQMKHDKKRFWAGDNISEYINEDQKSRLIDEAAEAFETVLRSFAD